MLLTDILRIAICCFMLLFFLGFTLFDLRKMQRENKSGQSLAWYRRPDTIIGIGGCVVSFGLLLNRLIPLIHQTHATLLLLPIIGNSLATIGFAIFIYGSFQRFTQQRRAQQRHTQP